MIHKTAIVDPRAELGDDVSVGPYAVVEGGVRIGAGCTIGPHVTIFEGVSIGETTRVHAGAVLGDVPQDLSFDGAVSYVRIGARCTIREGVTIHRGTKPETATEIGDDCFLMAFSHCAHNVRLGQRVIMANGVLLAGYAEVGDGVFLSGSCAVHQFVKIGRLAMVGGLSALTKDLPPFCTSRTNGINGVVGLNVVGLRRAGLSSDERADVKCAFDILFRAGLNTTQAAERLRREFDTGPAAEFVPFIEASTRGICTLSGG